MLCLCIVHLIFRLFFVDDSANCCYLKCYLNFFTIKKGGIIQVDYFLTIQIFNILIIEKSMCFLQIKHIPVINKATCLQIKQKKYQSEQMDPLDLD